jgi:endonuclease-3
VTPDDAGGTYVLLVDVPEPITLDVGALGEHRLPAGAYLYVGSALGSGGFARVDRHRRVAAGEHDVRHWHVDALLGHPATSLHDAYTAAGHAVECATARALVRDPVVAGFGASDCDCPTHLAHRSTTAAAARDARGALAARGAVDASPGSDAPGSSDAFEDPFEDA